MIAQISNHPIILDILRQVFRAIGIQVVPEDGTTFLGSWHGERPNSGKNISDHVLRLEHLY